MHHVSKIPSMHAIQKKKTKYHFKLNSVVCRTTEAAICTPPRIHTSMLSNQLYQEGQDATPRQVSSRAPSIETRAPRILFSSSFFCFSFSFSHPTSSKKKKKKSKCFKLRGLGGKRCSFWGEVSALPLQGHITSLLSVLYKSIF